MNPELKEQIEFCQYIKENYPDVTYFCDLVDKLTKGARFMYQHLRSGDNPDIFICSNNNKSKGLFIELKQTGTVIINTKGNHKFPHQNNKLLDLINKGYEAVFCCGYKEAVEVFEDFYRRTND